MNKLKKFLTLTLASCLVLTFISCEQEENADDNTTFLGLLTVSQAMADATKRCETVIDGSYTSGSYAPLCTPTVGQGRFFRIEGMKALGDNGYFYLFLGYSAAPTSATPAATGQYAFVAGKSVSSPNPYVWFRNLEYGNYQGGQAASGANPTNFSLSTDQELCVSFSGTATAPTTYLWVTGVGGANCKLTNTLQKENAVINYSAWPSSGNVIPSGTQAYFRFSNVTLLTGTKIVVSSESIL
ncbi:hypothetical protein CLV96_3177 [Leptospira meyeri]|uniref:Lipoprotein n=1 Tax=Leptospira meyeri TaxID=29508 RepID=A0A4R8MTM2_LEPME|nr:hypothetical protein [Leptospira meyeri]EKJ85880.1 putative lipoprotein [Leptospira meyeri serovar Hardjo str. Went 5]TDY68660.1 hypothetical protein CLV96_3177 [Leptospira meyeri]TGL50770.1 hypothetical protein EHQ55_06960 [Leptospira meyeri]